MSQHWQVFLALTGGIRLNETGILRILLTIVIWICLRNVSGITSDSFLRHCFACNDVFVLMMVISINPYQHVLCDRNVEVILYFFHYKNVSWAAFIAVHTCCVERVISETTVVSHFCWRFFCFADRVHDCCWCHDFLISRFWILALIPSFVLCSGFLCLPPFCLCHTEIYDPPRSVSMQLNHFSHLVSGSIINATNMLLNSIEPWENHLKAKGCHQLQGGCKSLWIASSYLLKNKSVQPSHGPGFVLGIDYRVVDPKKI